MLDATVDHRVDVIDEPLASSQLAAL